MQLEAPKTLFGEPCRLDEVEQVRSWITDNPGWSRYRLSRELCNRWQWVRPNGQLADMAARHFLSKLHGMRAVNPMVPTLA